MDVIQKFKPGARRSTHLWLSALLWTTIGCLLLAKGFYRFSQLPDHPFWLIGAAFVAGFMKSMLVLDKSARKTISRIQDLKEGSCIGAVYSPKTWLMVLCMMILGIFLRNSSLPVTLLCFIYFTIGSALVISSRLGWQAYRLEKRAGSSF